MAIDTIDLDNDLSMASIAARDYLQSVNLPKTITPSTVHRSYARGFQKAADNCAAFLSTRIVKANSAIVQAKALGNAEAVERAQMEKDVLAKIKLDFDRMIF